MLMQCLKLISLRCCYSSLLNRVRKSSSTHTGPKILQRTFPSNAYKATVSVAEISNEYSKRWVNWILAPNFWYLYVFILILMSYSNYSYSKFEVLTVLILNNTHNVVDFDSVLLNIFKNHKRSIICVRTLQHLLEGCVLALLTVFLCFFVFFCLFVNATTTTKTVTVNGLNFWNHLWVL